MIWEKLHSLLQVEVSMACHIVASSIQPDNTLYSKQCKEKEDG